MTSEPNIKELLQQALNEPHITGGVNREWSAPTVEQLSEAMDKYQVQGLISCGGMGAVYRALKGEDTVAIKILPKALAEDEAFGSRFDKEVKALENLDHPNIVKFLDHGTLHSGEPFLVMEYVDGHDLNRWIHSSKNTFHQTLSVVSQICAALKYAHSEGYIHRDIKPANILADIYSLGVLLYEALTGDIPRGVFPLPSSRGWSSKLDEIVSLAMQSDPDKRIQNASDFLSLLKAVEGKKSSEEVVKKRWNPVLAAFTCIGLGAFVGFGVMQLLPIKYVAKLKLPNEITESGEVELDEILEGQRENISQFAEYRSSDINYNEIKANLKIENSSLTAISGDMTKATDMVNIGAFTIIDEFLKKETGFSRCIITFYSPGVVFKGMLGLGLNPNDTVIKNLTSNRNLEATVKQLKLNQKWGVSVEDAMKRLNTKIHSSVEEGTDLVNLSVSHDNYIESELIAKTLISEFDRWVQTYPEEYVGSNTKTLIPEFDRWKRAYPEEYAGSNTITGNVKRSVDDLKDPMRPSVIHNIQSAHSSLGPNLNPDPLGDPTVAKASPLAKTWLPAGSLLGLLVFFLLNKRRLK